MILTLLLSLIAQTEEVQLLYDEAQGQSDLTKAKVLFQKAKNNPLSELFNHHENNAEELLIRIHEKLPGTPIAEEALLEFVRHLEIKKDWSRLETYLTVFLDNYPMAEEKDWALQTRIESAYKQYAGPEYDQTCLLRILQYQKELVETNAILWNQLAEKNPLLLEIDEELAKGMLLQAKFYQKRGDKISERFVLRRLIQKYPDTEAAANARKRL